jgi:hypothetical protein
MFTKKLLQNLLLLLGISGGHVSGIFKLEKLVPSSLERPLCSKKRRTRYEELASYKSRYNPYGGLGNY